MGPLRVSLTEQMTRLRGDAPEALVDAVVERVDLPGGPLLRARPRSFDAVREAEALAGPGRPTPYWASQWPSGVALARHVAGRDLAGLRVLESGAGSRCRPSLYRPDNHESLQELLPQLAREVWIADPGRGGCRDFLAVARSRWRVESAVDAVLANVRIHRLSAARSRAR